MYALSIISSVLGILSFVLAFVEKFKNWKKYFLYSAFLMIGLTAGVLMSMSERAMHQFTTSQVMILLIAISIIALAAFFINRFLHSSNEVMGIVILVFIISAVAFPNMIRVVDKTQSFLKPSDYLTLSRAYEQKQDYAKAADFLQRYKELDGDNIGLEVYKQIGSKIDTLRKWSIEK